MISRIDQTGPIGKLITLRLTPELLQKLNMSERRETEKK